MSVTGDMAIHNDRCKKNLTLSVYYTDMIREISSIFIISDIGDVALT